MADSCLDVFVDVVCVSAGGTAGLRVCSAMVSVTAHIDLLLIITIKYNLKSLSSCVHVCGIKELDVTLPVLPSVHFFFPLYHNC